MSTVRWHLTPVGDAPNVKVVICPGFHAVGADGWGSCLGRVIGYQSYAIGTNSGDSGRRTGELAACQSAYCERACSFQGPVRVSCPNQARSGWTHASLESFDWNRVNSMNRPTGSMVVVQRLGPGGKTASMRYHLAMLKGIFGVPSDVHFGDSEGSRTRHASSATVPPGRLSTSHVTGRASHSSRRLASGPARCANAMAVSPLTPPPS